MSENVAKNLKSLMEDKDIILIKNLGKETGKNMGISRCRVYEWKKGAIPQARTLMLIADYFKTTVDFLLGRTDDF